MFLKKTPNKSGRINLAIVDGYYDKATKKTKHKVIESLGYLDELEKQYDDPIDYFTKRAKKLTEEKKARQAPINFTFYDSDRLCVGDNLRKNFGYTALSNIYHELELDKFLNNRQRHTKESYDANTILKMLVYSRILAPASKKSSFDHREMFFEKTNYSIDDVYRCLSFLNKHKETIQVWMNDKIKENYGRDTSLIYYDVTNYYFETDEQNDFLRKGVSKEHRPNFGKIKKRFNLGRVISVADKGMTTGDNIWYTINTPAHDGYVFSMSIRGAEKSMKKYVLDDDGYVWLGKEYKRKSRKYPRTIQVTSTSGKKIKKQVDEKQIVFWSEKYAKRAKAEREATLAKARDLAANPGSYTRISSIVNFKPFLLNSLIVA